MSTLVSTPDPREDIVRFAIHDAYYAKPWGAFDAEELAGPAIAALISAGYLPAQPEARPTL